MTRYRKERRDAARRAEAAAASGLPIVPSLAAAGRVAGVPYVGAVVLANARVPAARSQLAVSSDAGPTADPPAVYLAIPGPGPAAGQSVRVAFAGRHGSAALDMLINDLAVHRERVFGGEQPALPTHCHEPCYVCGETLLIAGSVMDSGRVRHSQCDPPYTRPVASTTSPDPSA